MLDYGYAKLIANLADLYNPIPLPVVFCDENFIVHWSNSAAQEFCRPLTEEGGLQAILEPSKQLRIKEEIDRWGKSIVRGIFPPGSACLSISPIGQEGRAGFLAIYLQEEALPPSDSIAQPTQAAENLAGSIRDAANDMFEALDNAAGKAELMKAGWLKHSLNQVSVGNYGVLRIADNMALFARYTNGAMSGQGRRIISLTAYLRELQPMLEELCGEAGIPLEFDISSRECYVNIHLSQFENALYNLLHNSFSYTKGGSWARLSARPEGGSLVVEVEDEGLGIPPEHLKRVQMPYEVYRHSGCRVGAGLGLALVRLIAREHGGEFFLSSRVGRGTSARICLPMLSPFQMPLNLSQERIRPDSGNRYSAAHIGLVDVLFRTRY